MPIGKDDSAERKTQKQWYNYRLLQLQRLASIRCLDERLSYEAAHKLLDAELQLANGPVAKIWVQLQRLRLKAEAPPGPGQ